MLRIQVWLNLSLFLGAFCSFPVVVLAQGQDSVVVNASNVHFETLGDRISIRYDLRGLPEIEHRVTVALRRESDPSFRHPLVKTSGDVGVGVYAGMYKKILWEIREEFPEGLPGDDYYFVVNADPVSSESSALLWIGAGVAAIGGVATYFLLRQNDENSTPAAVPSGFPAPPGRP